MYETKLILALDVDSFIEAQKIIDELGSLIDYYKIGSILFTLEGKKVIEYLKNKEKKVFLDLKYFDIPNTVKGACKSAADIGADMITIHLLGGKEMILNALEGLNSSRNKSLILGVTILTSMNDNILKNELKISLNTEEMVSHLVEIGYNCGIKGFVCSPQELKLLRKKYNDIIIVTPGIRFDDDKKDDQKRVMDPLSAKEAGANFIVSGRSILVSENRLDKIKRIIEALK